jgi:hypothetical protein
MMFISTAFGQYPCQRKWRERKACLPWQFKPGKFVSVAANLIGD